MLGDEFLFAQDDDPVVEDTLVEEGWKVLVVDDESEVHHITRIVLSGFVFDERPLDIISANSAAQAREILQADKGHTIAVAIVDVVMETQHAGLDLIRWVREELHNNTIRLVLRTGQPGEAPEESVIRDYDLNDYKNKTELTALRLKTLIYAALRGYRDIKTIQRHRKGLERIIGATSEFLECDTLPDFASAILSQISVVMAIESKDIVCCAATRESTIKGSPELNVLASNTHKKEVCPNSQLSATVEKRIKQALDSRQSIYHGDYFVGYFTTKRGTENVLYASLESSLDEMQHQLLSFFAHNIAVAHENLKLRDLIKESQKELSYVIGEAVEMRSRETGSHVKRVAHITYLLAKKYGMAEQDAEMIKLASPLHDVGKVGIPDMILNKPGKHTAEETIIMRTHAKIGFDMLSKSDNPILQLGAHIAHEHHENWDGSGYPRGLKGIQIHISGRISAVADVFDALGSNRCYKKAWAEDDIVAFFKQQSGIKFEPRLVDILLASLDELREIKHKFPDPDE